MPALRIVIAGGTGRLGRLLAHHFHEKGQLVSTIARFPSAQAWPAVHWDAQTLGDWSESLNGADAVINLAGRSMQCRYTKANRRVIVQSRIQTTELIAEAINQCTYPPRVWLNASLAVEPDSLQQSFRKEVADAWELATLSHATPYTRQVLIRLAPLMTPEPGGTFDLLLRLVRWGIGGEMGDGEQTVSWIHDFDFVRAIEFLIRREDIGGPVAIAAPHPVPNHQFMCNLRRAWCTSYFGLSLPTWLIEAAVVLLRREADLALRSNAVVPQVLLDQGFDFHFPHWRAASENLVERWRLQQD